MFLNLMFDLYRFLLQSRMKHSDFSFALVRLNSSYPQITLSYYLFLGCTFTTLIPCDVLLQVPNIAFLSGRSEVEKWSTTKRCRPSHQVKPMNHSPSLGMGRQTDLITTARQKMKNLTFHTNYDQKLILSLQYLLSFSLLDC